MSEVILVTTPSIPGYRVKRILGVVHGMTARTRGVGGGFIASIQTALAERSQHSPSRCRRPKKRL